MRIRRRPRDTIDENRRKKTRRRKTSPRPPRGERARSRTTREDGRERKRHLAAREGGDLEPARAEGRATRETRRNGNVDGFPKKEKKRKIVFARGKRHERERPREKREARSEAKPGLLAPAPSPRTSTRRARAHGASKVDLAPRFFRPARRFLHSSTPSAGQASRSYSIKTWKKVRVLVRVKKKKKYSEVLL